MTFEDGEVLFHRGDSGRLRLRHHGRVRSMSCRTPMTVWRWPPRFAANELFGELGVITNETRSATLRANGALQALRISDEMFLKLLADNADLALDVMRQLSLKLTRTHRQYEDARRELARYRAEG